jgi:hypothetical protein
MARLVTLEANPDHSILRHRSERRMPHQVRTME